MIRRFSLFIFAIIVSLGAIPYCRRTLTEFYPNVNMFVWAGVLLLVIILLGHWLLDWMTYRPVSSPATTAGHRWKWRWTILLTAILLTIFAAGLSMMGIIHQSVWLATQKQVSPSRESLDQLDYTIMLAAGMEAWDMPNGVEPGLQPNSRMIPYREYLHIVPVRTADGSTRAIILVPRDPAKRRQLGIFISRQSGALDQLPDGSVQNLIHEFEVSK